jgi:hypothetical protein
MINRRKFLLIAASATAAAAAGAYVATPALRRLLHPELDTAYPLGTLRDEEMQCIVALGEAIAAPQSVPPPEFFFHYVNAVTQKRNGILKEYRRAAALLNSTATGLYGEGARRRFVDLSRTDRDKVLQTLLWRYPAHDRIVHKVETLFASRDALALRAYVMEPLIEHYYRSMYGWAVVGYDSMPGRPPRDPRSYTRLPIDSATST